MKKKLSYFFASLFGVGFIKKASGTFGSFASFLLIIPFMEYYKINGILFLLFISFILGLFTINEVLKHTEHDPSFVVIDEFIGQTITFLFVPTLNYWWIYLLGFILFRFFDITKPLFIGWVDKKIKNSLGVILDDILAGLIASIILWIIKFFI